MVDLGTNKKYGLFDLNKYIAKETCINRLALHAASISFYDLKGKSVRYEASKNNQFEVKADMVAIYKEAYDNIMEAIGNDLDADKTYDWTTNDPPILIFENEHKTYTKLL